MQELQPDGKQSGALRGFEYRCVQLEKLETFHCVAVSGRAKMRLQLDRLLTALAHDLM